MYQLSGKVIKGDGYGKVLGFPTANLDRRSYSRRKMKLRLGVYSGHAKIEGNPLGQPQRVPLKGTSRWKAAIVIGPIDKTDLPKIEAHLINFKGNLYGKKIILSLEKYIRPFKKFLSADVLKRQIAKDIKEIKELGNYGK